jgi:hypothetical protein
METGISPDAQFTSRRNVTSLAARVLKNGDRRWKSWLRGGEQENMGRNQPTESNIYTGDEHHDETNMGHNQGIVTQSGEQIKSHTK